MVDFSRTGPGDFVLKTRQGAGPAAPRKSFVAAQRKIFGFEGIVLGEFLSKYGTSGGPLLRSGKAEKGARPLANTARPATAMAMAMAMAKARLWYGLPSAARSRALSSR